MLLKMIQGLERELAIDVHPITKVNIDNLVEDRGFDNTKTRKPSEKEIRRLKKRIKF